MGRIGTLLAMGEFHGIESMVAEADALLRAAGDQDYLQRLHINLASGLFHQERYAEANAAFTEALHLLDAAGRRDALWASLMLNHGIALNHLAQVDEAQEAFQATEDYGRAHGQDRMVAQALFNKGVLEGLRGGYRSALRFLAEAEETFDRQDVHELLAATHLEQAQMYLDLSMATEGRDLARRAAEAFLDEGMLLDQHLARLAEARAALMLGRPGESIQILGHAERFYREQGLPGRRSQALLGQAQAFFAQGDLDAARGMCAKAKRIADRLDLKGLRSACRCLQAEIHVRKGDPERAEGVLRAARALLPSLALGDRAEYWATAARVSRAAGRTHSAVRRYRQALRCVEAQRALIPGLELRTRSFERGARVYHELIGLKVSSQSFNLDRVLRLIERARGRTFREMVASAPVGTAHESLARSRGILGSMVRRLDQIEMSEQPDRESEAEKLRKRIRQAEREITVRVRRLESDMSAATGSGTFKSATQLVSVLEPDELLVEYFVAEDRIIAALIGKTSRALRVLDTPASTLKKTLDHLRLQLEGLAATADKPTAGPAGMAFMQRTAEARLRELHAMVLAPLLRGDDPVGRLTIVPHDILHQVPFECLHDGAGFVSDHRRIARCPTADFLIERRRTSRQVSAGHAVVIAGTRPGADFIEREALQVRECLGGERARFLLDPSAAEALTAMRSARIIHVSAHGSFRADNPLFSTLHLGSGVLFLGDILEASLAADLVVLSACNSGQAFSGRGDALLGVAHAFLAAGARRLVAPLWRVHDQATADWMEVFHRSYRDLSPPDPSSALRDASRSVRGEWPHPFYWGGFCVIGD